jgi:UDP-N-acetylmuramoylalanine--D-glutamate ligase
MSELWNGQNWKRAGVYGLGISGLAASRLLRSRGVEVVGIDRRDREDLDLGDLADDCGMDWMLGTEGQTIPESIEGLVVSPGIPSQEPLLELAREESVPIVSEIELAAPLLNGPVVGITGSNGKSTTTALTGLLLRKAGHQVEICGNYGVPLSACVDGEAGRVFVTELSSFQLEYLVNLHPRVAAILNVTADHLDRHSDLKSYAAIKEAILGNQTADDVAVLNADDPIVAAMAVKARRRLFSRRNRVDDGCYLDGDEVVEARPGGDRKALFRRDDLAIPGVHNLENAMASALIATSMDAYPKQWASALSMFNGLPHRLEKIASINGVTWFDDSKGTNVGATSMSLEGFDDASVHIILGGRNKGGDFFELRRLIERKAVKAYLIGEAAGQIYRDLEGSAEMTISRSMESAIDAAYDCAGRGEVVVLSPACASFDQYSSFEERGDHFQTLVKALEGRVDG